MTAASQASESLPEYQRLEAAAEHFRMKQRLQAALLHLGKPCEFIGQNKIAEDAGEEMVLIG